MVLGCQPLRRKDENAGNSGENLVAPELHIFFFSRGIGFLRVLEALASGCIHGRKEYQFKTFGAPLYGYRFFSNGSCSKIVLSGEAMG